jgi:periplasmic divalent cation tolerance protein
VSGAIAVLVTAGSGEEAERIARTLVEERLAACVNVVSGVRSLYRWEGRVAEDTEHLLVIKSRRELLPRLEQRVRELHSYSVPEVVALEVIGGSRSYLEWLFRETEPG